MLYLLIFLSVCGVARPDTNSRCSRSINVDQQESGVIYEYIRGEESTCVYEFRAKETQRIMLSVNHIGLLPRNDNEECVPMISIADLLFTGEERMHVSICNAEDAKTKGNFVSAAKSARVEYNGPSDSDGILLIQFWFVQDVTLIRRVPEPPKDVTGESFVTLECPSWGATLELESCSCVDYETRAVTNLEPPFCLIPPQTLMTKCLQEVSEVRHNLATNMLWTNQGQLPPSCDDQGNYKKLQCDGDSVEPCHCVDPLSGDNTNLMPPNCEFPITTTTEMPLTTMTMKVVSLVCKLISCQEYCPYGQEKDASGCPTCECKAVVRSAISEICSEATFRILNEITKRKELVDKTAPYPWIPDCSEDGNFKARQCDYKTGCICVDQESGLPNGRKSPDCGTYKDCVTKRIAALYRVLRDAGHRKTAKLVRGLLTGNDANDFQFAIDMLSQEAFDSISSDPATYIPSCNAYGDYEAVQCRLAEGTCWCADVRGDEIGGSENSNVVPDCSMYRRQVSQMPVSTDEKRSYSVRLNDLHILYCDFMNISESDDMFIFWTQNGVPVSSFNDIRYTSARDVYYLYPKATTWLKIDPVLAEDVGSYACEIADTANDYFYKSDPHSLTVWDPDQNEAACVIKACDKYCGMGYKDDHQRCRTCECFQMEEVTDTIGGFYHIQRELFQPFGTHDGRCEAKRQILTKQLLELDFNDQYLKVNIENFPLCDSDGNYQQIQNMQYFGRICVDKMSGQVSGRIVPDCNEWSACIEQASRSTETIISFFTNESTGREVYNAGYNAQTLGERFAILDQAFLVNVPIEYEGDTTELPPVKRCDSNTGSFYSPIPVCSHSSSECWCIDTNGEELEETRSGVNETMPPCRYWFPPAHGPNLLSTNESRINAQNGSTITLNCDVSSYSPDTFVLWSTPSGATLEQMMVIDERFQPTGDQVTGFSMRITNVQEKDTGTYTCFLYNFQSPNDIKQYSIYVDEL